MKRLTFNLDEIHYLQVAFFPYSGQLFQLSFYTACFGLEFRVYNPNEDEYYRHQQWVARAYGLEDDFPF